MMLSHHLERGDVWLLHFRPPDRAEISLYKFGLVLQSRSPRDRVPSVVVALLTTKKLDFIHRFDVYVKPAESGTLSGAKIMLHQLYTIPRSHLICYKYSLSVETMREVDRKLRLSLEIESLSVRY